MAQETLKTKMLYMRNLQIILLMCFIFTYGCTSKIEPQRRSIALNAALGEVLVESNLQTKASADPYTGVPTQQNPLEVALWFSYSPGSYSHAPQAPQYLPCATTVEYTSSALTDISWNGNILQYPIETDANYNTGIEKVYCIGLHPYDGWGELTTNPVTSVQHDINGSEDLMFADQMVGSYKINFRPQTFEHLLTWVKINLSAASLETAGVWGDVEYLKIYSPESIVKISFSNEPEADSTPQASVVSYTGGQNELQLELPDDKSLSITTRTFGQAFCAPPVEKDGKFGYTVKVKTSNVSEKEIFVDLKKEDNVTPVSDAGYAIGKLFVINLHFDEIGVVKGVCTLRQWDDQNSDIYLK